MIMKYINMDPGEHDTLLGNRIEGDEDYKAARKTLQESLSLLDRKTGIAIEDKAGYVETLARDISFDEGFNEGIRFILGCVSTSHTDKGMDYNQALKREDYKRAWGLKVEAYNRLMDLLRGHGADVDTAIKMVEEYSHGVREYAFISAKLGLPEAI